MNADMEQRYGHQSCLRRTFAGRFWLVAAAVLLMGLAGCGGSSGDDDDNETNTGSQDNPPRIKNFTVNVDINKNININADIADDDRIDQVNPFISEYDPVNGRYMMWIFGPGVYPGVPSTAYSWSYTGDFVSVCQGNNCNPSATNIRFDQSGEVYLTGECENPLDEFECYARISYGSNVDDYELTDLSGNPVSVDTFYPVKLYLTALDKSGVLKTSKSTTGIDEADLAFGSTVLSPMTYEGGIEARDSSDQSNFEAGPFSY